MKLGWVMFDKAQLGYISLFFALMAGTPYIWSILKKETRPHIFSHVIWGLMSSIAAAAQYSADAGPGAWATAVNVVFNVLTVLLSFSYGERTITRGDWIAFILGLSAIPLWYVTANPLIAVVLVTLIDIFAYYPTFRKSYCKPESKAIPTYVIGDIRTILSILAITDYSVTTILYPATIVIMNSALVIMIEWRKYILRSLPVQVREEA